METIVGLTKKFIAIQSISQNSRELKKILELALSQLKGYSIERFQNNGVMSALVYNTKKRPKRFRVLLNCHLDIIPGKKEQYTPRIKKGRMYGAGVMDMKANVACAIAAFRDVARDVRFPIGIQFVTDEEIGGFNGTKYQIEKGVRADFIITTEPTNFDIVNEAKGIIWMRVKATGVAAHSAYPWCGDNAIHMMGAFLSAILKEYPSPRREAWATTVSVNRIETANQSLNKIPDSCVAEIDVRYIPRDATRVMKKIVALLPRGFSYEILAHEPPLATNVSNRDIRLLRMVGGRHYGKALVIRKANGSSDARHFARVKVPGIEFGPIGGGIGSDNEWVDISSLETYRTILKDFLLSLR